jgi:hypothetical protein
MHINEKDIEILFHYNKKVLLYVKWFHWILSEFTSCNEQDLVKMFWTH